MGRRRKFQEIFKIKGFKLLEIKMWNTCLSNFVCCLRFFWIWELKAYIMCTNVNPGHSRCMTQCQNLGPMATLIYIVQSFIYYYCVICIHGCSSLEFYSADVIDNVGDNTKPCCTLDVTNWWVLVSPWEYKYRDLLSKYYLIHSFALPLTPMVSIHRIRRLWSMVSNACLKSSKRSLVAFPISVHL